MKTDNYHFPVWLIVALALVVLVAIATLSMNISLNEAIGDINSYASECYDCLSCAEFSLVNSK